MKIALINESSQANKNSLIYRTLKKTVEPMGHEVFNYGMNEEDLAYDINYADAGLLAAILLNAKAVDFVVTGCGSGEGACIAANIYPNVICGYIKEVTDAYLFSQINYGNAISMPFAKDFGWCAELNLQYVFEKLFGCEHGTGYPVSRGSIQKEFREYFEKMKRVASKDIVDILKELDADIVRKVIQSKNFDNYFYHHAKEENIIEIVNYVKDVKK